jgi:hypothetical protein
LIENAFVIQLWHYTEHTYFKGASVLAATAVAYREQLVWVRLLGCVHQLKGGERGLHEGHVRDRWDGLVAIAEKGSCGVTRQST